ncbi:MAG TPA: PadR family transcriptional regulator [Nitrososphaerales archaeon]|nr:PadR family transcriptional regulator [Nitrososphaerales archaeon]
MGSDMAKNGAEVFAPKGLLRMLILKIASTKPVTGVEIMQEVPEMTEKLWSPSPGSVYYLLGEMEEDGMLIHVPTGEAGIKRYVSSEKGKLSLESFKLDARKNLYRQMIMLRILSDLAEDRAASDAISSLSKKVAL